MNTQQPQDSPDKVTPTRKDRMRPVELIGFAAVLAVFAGLVVLLTTRQIALASIFAGVGFIVVVMIVALLGLGGKRSDEDIEAAKDLSHPDDVWH